MCCSPLQAGSPGIPEAEEVAPPAPTVSNAFALGAV